MLGKEREYMINKIKKFLFGESKCCKEEFINPWIGITESLTQDRIDITDYLDDSNLTPGKEKEPLIERIHTVAMYVSALEDEANRLTRENFALKDELQKKCEGNCSH